MSQFIINKGWDRVLDLKVIEKKLSLINSERKNNKILPVEGNQSGIFYALKLTDFEDVRVLIIGQDPYPNENHAHGLAFSTKSGVVPDSLKNIFNKIKQETGINNTYGNLEYWAKQGVLLLNRALTYQENKTVYGFWKPVIIDIIENLLKRDKKLVIILWGNPANELFDKNKILSQYLNSDKVLVLRSSHPSNLGCNKEGKYGSFNNCKHFSQCNNFLDKPIDWHTV